MKEREILKVILDWLSWQKDIWHMRMNTGAVKIDKRFIRFNKPGCPDILVMSRGRMLALEVKTAKGKQSDLQTAWAKEWEAHGGMYRVVRCLDDAARAVDSLQNSILVAVSRGRKAEEIEK